MIEDKFLVLCTESAITGLQDAGFNPYQPEKKLAWNIILRAMLDYIAGPCKDITIYQSAEAFLFKDPPNRIFGFRWLLDNCSQDPDNMQDIIISFCTKWRKKYRRKARYMRGQKVLARVLLHNTINDGYRI